MESTKVVFFVVCLTSLVGLGLSIPVASSLPSSEEALVAKPKVPNVTTVTAPLTPEIKKAVDDLVASIPKEELNDNASGDLDTADTFLLGIGFPGWWAGVGPFYGGPAYGFGGYGGYGGYYGGW